MEDTITPEEAIFYDALQVADPQEREALIERACAGDAGLRGAVDALFAGHHEASRFFGRIDEELRASEELVDEAAEAPAYTDASVGTSIGPYKLIQWLGEGGGGIVYRAEQERPVRREVALKIIKLGMDTKRVIARFEAERQTLALMNHPNIARVLEAGATETGRPFFVMELVRGTRITDYCEQNKVPLTQRLALFQQVCHAVQHAHQKGVIHRDLKPSNILITMQDGEPSPRVIDFGIAKATAGPLAEGTVFTAIEQMIGTPAYMSPEQVQGSGVDVDTRSDLYSLGVVLYELLTTRPPFENEELLSAGVDEMRRILREREPLRPSLKVEALRRANPAMAEPIVSAAALRGDLDWIVMKALEKDRERRYQTGRGLAFDLGRHLAHEPVSARPPSRRYRLRKLVLRNKATFAAIGATTCALLAGLALSTWLFLKAREAERQQMHLRAVAEQALAQEGELRRRAEEREKITRAAILLSRQKLEEADAVLGETAFPVSQPSVEATQVFRALGFWSALHGNWSTAASRLLALVQVNRIDESDKTDEATRDLLTASAVLVEVGDLDDYEKICAQAIERFASTTNPVAAEHVIKINALRPIKGSVQKLLEPLQAVAENSLRSRAPEEESYVEGWRNAVLGLLEYRRGHYREALTWCDRCLAHRDQDAARTALVYLVQAMSFHALHQPVDAQARLKQARQLIDDAFSRPLRAETSPLGWWYDWLGARILCREATRAIAPEMAPPS